MVACCFLGSPCCSVHNYLPLHAAWSFVIQLLTCTIYCTVARSALCSIPTFSIYPLPLSCFLYWVSDQAHRFISGALICIQLFNVSAWSHMGRTISTTGETRVDGHGLHCAHSKSSFCLHYIIWKAQASTGQRLVMRNMTNMEPRILFELPQKLRPHECEQIWKTVPRLEKPRIIAQKRGYCEHCIYIYCTVYIYFYLRRLFTVMLSE